MISLRLRSLRSLHFLGLAAIRSSTYTGSLMVSTLHRFAQGAAGFVPYHELGGRPDVVVDGAPTTGTVLCLSHWPGIASPPRFQADLSAQMAFAYLEAYDRHHPATAVSNNHFDQDGLVSIYALARPEAASPVGLAAAGAGAPGR
jgi:hypothetical protein